MLEMEMLKKEEKLYAAEFQIQLLERKVGRASGERSNLEELETTRIIKELEGTLNDVKHEEASVNAQVCSSSSHPNTNILACELLFCLNF